MRRRGAAGVCFTVVSLRCSDAGYSRSRRRIADQFAVYAFHGKLELPIFPRADFLFGGERKASRARQRISPLIGGRSAFRPMFAKNARGTLKRISDFPEFMPVCRNFLFPATIPGIDFLRGFRYFFAFGDNFSVLFFQSIKRAENTENRCVREKHAVKSVKGEKQL